MMEMPLDVSIDDDNVDWLKQFAEPLRDDVNSVLRKVRAAFEARDSAISTKIAPISPGPMKDEGIREFDPADPPSLRHTTPTRILLGGRLFKPSETYWNTLLVEVIRRAAEVLPKEDVPNLIIVNHQTGERTDTGFRYIPVADVSVQGQDSVMAWKAIYHIAAQLGFPVEVEFRWLAKHDAAYPNGRGRLRVNA